MSALWTSDEVAAALEAPIPGRFEANGVAFDSRVCMICFGIDIDTFQ